MDLFSLCLSFVEGLGIVLSPCILPILPFILAAGIHSGRARPYGVILGFVFMFVSFTLLSRKVLSLFSISPIAVQNASYALLFLFGLVLLFERLSILFDKITAGLSQIGTHLSDRAESSPNHMGGLVSGFFIGSCIALIWTPCAGPIMAAVLVQIIQQTNDYKAALMLLSFSLGAGFPMLMIALLGQRFARVKSLLLKHTWTFRKILGIIIITAVVALKFNLWQMLILSQAANASADTVIENKVTTQKPSNAYEIVGIDQWINSGTLTLSSLQKEGKVVLVDFWTYSCINCIRTLPFVKKWHEKYASKGLVVIGIHSPEFEFEKVPENVEKAVKDFGITYPVALDNTLKTWTNFDNHYWPAHYLIDQNGRVVHTHFGEGEYDVMEQKIRETLKLNDKTTSNSGAEEFISRGPVSPETYLGYERTRNFRASKGLKRNKSFTYAFAKKIPLNGWSLDGSWISKPQCIVASEKGAKLRYHFTAAKVYLVMKTSSGKKDSQVKVSLDGKPLGKKSGADIKDGHITITKDRLYELVNASSTLEGTLEIEALTDGVEAYAFTFGS